MLRKLFSLALAVLMAAAALPFAMAEYGDIETHMPTEPVVTDGANACLTAEYLADEGLTRYTLELKDGANFSDGSAITAKDVLFTLYAQLDPACTDSAAAELDIDGLECYQLQVLPERRDEIVSDMDAIFAAGRDHEWSSTDAWTQEQQQTFWQIRDAYDAACESAYPAFAQYIVDLCAQQLTDETLEVFGRPAVEVAAAEGLRIAYAMTCWGYAFVEDNSELIANNSRTVWYLDSDVLPTLDDFVAEFKAVYGDDFGACWNVEKIDDYDPELPDIRSAFLNECIGDAHDSVTSISGIRMTGDRSVEVDILGIDMRAAEDLFGSGLLSLVTAGDEAQWNPDAGLYGHPFGDISAVDTSSPVQILDPDVNDPFLS